MESVRHASAGVGSLRPAGRPVTAMPIDRRVVRTAVDRCLAAAESAAVLFRYSILELNTAVKPWMFEHLFARGYDRVVYLDPDIRPLQSARPSSMKLPPETFLILTPHLTGSDRRRRPSQRAHDPAGRHLQPRLPRGFDGGRSSHRFLDWWQEKLEFQCVVDVARGLFVDQKWIDLAPGLFDRRRDPSSRRIQRRLLEPRPAHGARRWQRRRRSTASRCASFTSADSIPADPAMVSRHDFALQRDRGRRCTRADRRLSTPRIRAAGVRVVSERAPMRSAPSPTARRSPTPRESRIAIRRRAAGGRRARIRFAHPELFRGIATCRCAPQSRAWRGSPRRRTDRCRALRPLVLLFPRADAHSRCASFSSGAATMSRHRPRRASGTASAGPQHRRDTSRTTPASASPHASAATPARRPDSRTTSIDVDAMNDAAGDVSRQRLSRERRSDSPRCTTASACSSTRARTTSACWHWELPELPDAWIAVGRRRSTRSGRRARSFRAPSAARSRFRSCTCRTASR